jgi:hypothetical protein
MEGRQQVLPESEKDATALEFFVFRKSLIWIFQKADKLC